MAQAAARRKAFPMTLALITLSAFAAWIYLTFFRGGFWRADQRLRDGKLPIQWPDVVVVIPARDEEESIGRVVKSHLGYGYSGNLTVILADDGSSDATVERANEAAKGQVRGLDVVSVPPLPKGWSGKLWAVHNGLLRAKEIAPNAAYVLLNDADIALAHGSIRRLVAKAERDNLALTSLMARLDSRGTWGGLLIPAFIYFFQMLYPFRLANDPTENLAAAAGGCMLVRLTALEAAGGIEAIKGALIDDCALAQAIKDTTPSTKIWLGLANRDAVSLRDNQSLSSIWDMVARTAYAQLKYSPAMLVGTVIGMSVIFLTPPLAALTVVWHGNISIAALSFASWGLMARSYRPTLTLYDRPAWEAFTLPIVAGIYCAMTISSAQRHHRGEGGQWKGRTY